jgi:hypothetical protein
LIDADLAALYGVATKRLNEQVKRNRSRFPDDFVFQLSRAERDEVVANCDHLGRLKLSLQAHKDWRGGLTLSKQNTIDSSRSFSMQYANSCSRRRMPLSVVASDSYRKIRNGARS